MCPRTSRPWCTARSRVEGLGVTLLYIVHDIAWPSVEEEARSKLQLLSWIPGFGIIEHSAYISACVVCGSTHLLTRSRCQQHLGLIWDGEWRIGTYRARIDDSRRPHPGPEINRSVRVSMDQTCASRGTKMHSIDWRTEGMAWQNQLLTNLWRTDHEGDLSITLSVLTVQLWLLMRSTDWGDFE